MSMTDPIADMLARIRNAQGAEHDTVEMPLSKVKIEIARILKAEGYIADYKTTIADSGHPALSVRLKYGQGRARTISGIKRISKPGGRVHASSTELPKVLGGMGIAILSTSSGMMTDREAKRVGVGGEVIAHVW
ncbi:MAG: 30S ribosomal protein S8 [Actinobacteria bacterium]|nr:MAG: 30S ribosomal protein S8 [Actinomycetota bacterium]